jgi:hypothetical protein
VIDEKRRPDVGSRMDIAPVLECAHSVMMRAIIGTPKSYKACAMRYTLTASTPGIGQNHFVQFVAAGSPSKAACTSRIKRAAYLRQTAQENLRQFVRAWCAGAGRELTFFALAPVAQTMFHFALELGRQPRHGLGHMRAQILLAQVAAAEIAGYMRSSTASNISTMASRDGR